MKLAILTCAQHSELSPVENRPEYRKATALMKNASGVCELALKRLPESLQFELRSEEYKNLCMILGTSLGEIEVTREFLVTLDEQGMARPILFQNSLHNAVNGFITMALGLKGPSVTVSNRFFTAENAVQTAQLLLNEQQPYGLIVCGEIIVEDFLPGYSKIYPPHVKLQSGACAIVTATEEAVNRQNLKPLGWIEDIKYDLIPREAKSPTSSYYDSDGLQRIIESRFEKQNLSLPKPDGTKSIISLI